MDGAEIERLMNDPHIIERVDFYRGLAEAARPPVRRGPAGRCLHALRGGCRRFLFRIAARL
jgi:hypothetical protein